MAVTSFTIVQMLLPRILPSLNLEKPRVIMLGPRPPLIGGMSSVMSNLEASSLARQCQLIVLNNGKTTPEYRCLLLGVGVQFRMLCRIMADFIFIRMIVRKIQA